MNKHQLFVQKMLDDDFRYYAQMCIIPALFCLVAAGMSVLNWYTHKDTLLLVTAVFSVVSGAQALFTWRFLRRHIRVAHVLFSINILTMFSYFILCGGTEGFSTIWLLLAPSFAFFFMGMWDGLITSLILLVELIFFFWLPVGQNLLIYRDYTPSFLSRFPLIYIVCLLVGFLLEWIRKQTYNSLKDAELRYRKLSARDALTGLYNRYYFNRYLSKKISDYIGGYGAMLLMDIDHFKHFNDTYGHLAGDEALQTFAKMLEAHASEERLVARWGGEEFVMILRGESIDHMEEIAETIRQNTEQLNIQAGKSKNLHITVSIGVAWIPVDENTRMEHLVSTADQALYRAKREGRNCVRISRSIVGM